MKRRTLLSASAAALALTGAGAFSANAWAQSTKDGGEVREDLRMFSQMLNSQIAYSIYLPPGFDPGATYPLLFLLHGAGGSSIDWPRFFEAKPALDAAIAEGRLPATVVAFADARRDPAIPSDQQDLTYNLNDVDGGFRYADMFVEEFVPFIENEYSAGGAKEQRAIGGLSMGGFGALSFALNHQDVFASAFGLSVGQRNDEQLVTLPMPDYNWRFARNLGRDLEGDARLNDVYRGWNLPDIIAREDPAELGKTAYYIDCGDTDPFLAGNALIAESLVAAGIAHEYYTHPGTHDGNFWIPALPRALDFTAAHFPK